MHSLLRGARKERDSPLYRAIRPIHSIAKVKNRRNCLLISLLGGICGREEFARDCTHHHRVWHPYFSVLIRQKVLEQSKAWPICFRQRETAAQAISAFGGPFLRRRFSLTKRCVFPCFELSKAICKRASTGQHHRIICKAFLRVFD